MSETQIKDTDFESIPLEELQICRFCSQSTDEVMITVCKCEGVLQWVHFSCLSSHIKRTGDNKCCLCKGLFTGIKIESVPLGFCSFIKNKEDIQAQIICFSFGFLFLYYILYLAFIDFILSEGLVHTVLRILLIVPTVFYGVLFTALMIGCLITLFVKYKNWRQRNHQLIVTLEPKLQDLKTASKNTEVQHQKEKTNVCPNNEEMANKGVSIKIEATDNKSEQIVKINTTDDNQNKMEIKEKGQ